MRWVHSPQGTPLSYLPARFPLGPAQNLPLFWHQGVGDCLEDKPQFHLSCQKLQPLGGGNTDSCLLLIEI